MSLESNSLSIWFGLKDKELCKYVAPLKKTGIFSYAVKKMLVAYINYEETCDAKYLFDKKVDSAGSCGRTLSFNSEDEELKNYIFSLDDSCKADFVKEAMRYYLLPNERKGDRRTQIVNKINISDTSKSNEIATEDDSKHIPNEPEITDVGSLKANANPTEEELNAFDNIPLEDDVY